MNFVTGNNIAISNAGSALEIRPDTIGLRLCYNLIIIRLLQAMVGDEISR